MRSVTSWLMAVLIFGMAAKAETKTELLHRAIEKVRTGHTETERTFAADRLNEFVSELTQEEIDDRSISSLIALLEPREDGVRSSVAACLRDIGPRARAAVPRLLQILHEVECLNVSATSEQIVRQALERLGERSPPRKKCFGYE
jgi:hypothetical protein